MPLQPKDDDLKNGWLSYWEGFKAPYSDPVGSPVGSPVKWNLPMPNTGPNGLGALSLYLNQYLLTATGGRAILLRGFDGDRFLRFKCNDCKDNWNVSLHLFIANESLAMPTDLIDWVKLHEHVCKSYKTTTSVSGGNCAECSWSWAKHEAAQPIYDELSKTWSSPQPPAPSVGWAMQISHYADVASKNVVKIAQIEESNKRKKETALPQVKTLREVKGRKFR
jgi:hypothetical protein